MDMKLENSILKEVKFKYEISYFGAISEGTTGYTYVSALKKDLNKICDYIFKKKKWYEYEFI